MTERKLKRTVRNQRGQGLMEYAMVVSIVSLAAVALLTFFGEIIIDTFYTLINDAFNAI